MCSNPVSRYMKCKKFVTENEGSFSVRKEMKCCGDSEILYYMKKFVILHKLVNAFTISVLHHEHFREVSRNHCYISYIF